MSDMEGGAPDPRFEGIQSYGFKDKNGLPIPNSMGYEAIRRIKGRKSYCNEDVALVLVQYDREELHRMVLSVTA